MLAYWGSACCINGFASVFLLSRDFTSTQIGIVVALGNILAVLLSPRVAAIADQSKKITIHHLVLVPAILFVASIAGLYLSGNVFWAVAIIFCLSLGLLQLLQPLTNSVSVYYVNHNVGINFGIPRATGSLTWAILSTILGIVIDKTGENAILVTAAIMGILMVVGVVVFPLIKSDLKEIEAANPEMANSEAANEAADSEMANSVAGKEAPNKTGFIDFVRIYPMFFVLMVGVVFIFFFQTVSNNYLYQLSDAIGGDTKTMGYAFTVQAIIEVPPMVLFTIISKKFSSKSLMIFAVSFFVLKSIAFAFVFNPITLYLAMILQMPSYAVFIPASIKYVNEHMREEDQFQGQAMMTAAYTLGAVIGSLLGGYLVESLGALPTQKIDLAVCIVGGVIAIIAIMLNKKRSK